MSRWRRVAAGLERYATVVIAAATIANVGVAFFQWRALQETNDLGYRPWVFVKQVSLSKNLPLEASVEIENTGRGPAKEFYTVGVSQVRLQAQPLPNRPDYPPPREAPSRGVLGPGQTRSIPVPTEVASAGQLQAILSGSYRLYVYGRLECSDHTGRRYWTTFCGFIRGKSFEWCANNNDAI